MVKVRDGQVANRPIYAAIDVSLDGEKDVLGLRAGTGGEGAKFWMSGSGTGCAAAWDRRTLEAMAKGFAREQLREIHFHGQHSSVEETPPADVGPRLGAGDLMPSDEKRPLRTALDSTRLVGRPGAGRT